ncbi:MAG: peptidylprolyl isomerase [Hyphomonadaceae bacterium]|nr:peptidylprolyl isomerase [Hyphomonadaceae bacterium]OUX94014.1 MAG: hypothetical protein CBB77_07095 [Hyphomonas sp. TMED17]
MNLKLLIGAVMLMACSACAEAEPAVEETGPAHTYEDVAAQPAQWRTVAPDNLVVLNTSKGRIVLQLLPEIAPRHVEQFRAYIRSGLYDGTLFHRVIKDFMAQGGDVAATHGEDKMMAPMLAEFTVRRAPGEMPMDSIGPSDSATMGFHKGFPLQAQPAFLAAMSYDGLIDVWMPHCPGVLSTARTGDPNSGNAQFFLITLDGQHLDREYTAKGRIIEGLDVARALRKGPAPDGFPVVNPDLVISAQLASDLPEGARPDAYIMRTDTPEWTQILSDADRDGTNICDLPPVPSVVVG